MKRDVPIAPSQLRALVLLLLCLPLVPTALFVRMVSETDALLENESRHIAMPGFRAQLTRAKDLATAARDPGEAVDGARRLFGEGYQVALYGEGGELLGGHHVVEPGADYLEVVVPRRGGDWSLGVWVDASAVAAGWNPFLVLAVVVTLGVLLAALTAGVTLTRQLKIQEIKSDALNAVSHELKTPLSSMRVLIETLEGGRVNGEAQRSEYLSLLMDENRRMGRVLSDFLNLARMERNRKTFRMSPTVAADAVAEAVAGIRPKVDRLGGRIRCYGPGDGPLVTGEHTSLVGVMAILLDNAVKYCHRTPDIEIVYFASGRFAYFLFKDRGPGIPRAFRRKIFDSFYQVDPTLSRRGGGCGLGLSIAWHVVAAHGGNIRHSPRRGRGSVFRFNIPLAPPGERRTAMGGAEARAPTTPTLLAS